MVVTGNKPGWGRIFLTLAAGFALATLTFNLGQWQTGRAQQKTAILEQQERALKAAPITPTSSELDLKVDEYRRIDIVGRWDPESVVYIDNRQFNGRPAVQVIQGFVPNGKSFQIPVDRGLLLRNPAEPRRSPEWPKEAENTDESIALRGTILSHFARSAELRGLMLGDADKVLKQEVDGFRLWSNFNLEDYAKETGRSVSNFVVTLQPVSFEPEAPAAAHRLNGFYLNAVKLPEQVAKHKGYAFQWYSMTAVLLILTAFFVYKEYLSDSRRSADESKG